MRQRVQSKVIEASSNIKRIGLRIVTSVSQTQSQVTIKAGAKFVNDKGQYLTKLDYKSEHLN